MLTIKLIRQDTTKILEGDTVNIYPAGKPEMSSLDSKPQVGEIGLCTNKVRQIVVELDGKPRVFYVGLDASQITGDVDLYEHAYIENSNGATTERVYAYN